MAVDATFPELPRLVRRRIYFSRDSGVRWLMLQSPCGFHGFSSVWHDVRDTFKLLEPPISQNSCSELYFPIADADFQGHRPKNRERFGQVSPVAAKPDGSLTDAMSSQHCELFLTWGAGEGSQGVL